MGNATVLRLKGVEPGLVFVPQAGVERGSSLLDAKHIIIRKHKQTKTKTNTNTNTNRQRQTQTDKDKDRQTGKLINAHNDANPI